MENRYVYRRIEDAIGSPLNIKESPHAWLTRKLRYDLREHKDIAHHSEMMALCLSAIAGNPSIDAQQISETVNGMLINALNKKLPYTIPVTKNEKENIVKNNNYDVYFKQLEELKKEIAAKNASKTGSTAQDNPK